MPHSSRRTSRCGHGIFPKMLTTTRYTVYRHVLYGTHHYTITIHSAGEDVPTIGNWTDNDLAARGRCCMLPFSWKRRTRIMTSVAHPSRHICSIRSHFTLNYIICYLSTPIPLWKEAFHETIIFNNQTSTAVTILFNQERFEYSVYSPHQI